MEITKKKLSDSFQRIILHKTVGYTVNVQSILLSHFPLRNLYGILKVGQTFSPHGNFNY